MKTKLNRVIRKMLLTATASLIGSNVSATVVSVPVTVPHGDSDKQIDTMKKQNIIKGVYKIQQNGDAKLIAAHRSHSSHRSHRSSSGYSSSTKKSNSKSSSSSSSKSKSSSTSSKSKSGSGYSSATPLMDNRAKTTQINIQHLGDREIKNVNIDRGADVTELIAILRALGFTIEEEKLDVDSNNQTLYTSEVEKAVIEFKAKNGLPSTGLVDKVTVQKLKSQRK